MYTHEKSPSRTTPTSSILYLRSQPLTLIATQITPLPYTLLVVVILVGGPPPQKFGLAAPDIDVLIEDLSCRLRYGHLLRHLDLLVNVRSGFLVDALELLLRRDLPVEQLLLEARDGVLGRAHALDFFAGAVRGTGVGHGVPAVAVRDVFEDQGAMAFGGVFLAVLDGGFDGEDVHAVDFEAGDVLAALVVFGQGGGAVGGGTHAVFVVWKIGVLADGLSEEGDRGRNTFAAEKYGEVP